LPAAALVTPMASIAADTNPMTGNPQDIMSKVANDMLAALDKNRAEVRRDPSAVMPLVDQILLPHFDTDYAARSVLGPHVRTATPDQIKRFTSTFYNALLKTYSGALADFTADRLTILPFRGDANADSAIVSTTVRRDSGQVVRVDYKLRKTPEGWKAWDVVIEGVSYVRNYKNDLGAEIDQKGLDEVITRLEKEGLSTRRAPVAKAGA
jgi:phospholipid transport system substrate-binding protein